VERHTETRPEGRGWAYIVMGLVWLWGGIYRTVWKPGIGSFASWLGLTVVIVSCFCIAPALWLLKSISLADRNRRRNVGLTLLSAYLIADVVFATLAIVKRTDVLSDFYLYSISTFLGVFNIFMGLNLFLEEPRGQNPGWLYLLAGLIPLLVGLVGIILQPRGAGVPISWTGILATCTVGLYLLAVSLILRSSSDLYRGKRMGCGDLIALLGYKSIGMLLLAFYFCVMLVFFGLSFASTMPETSHFCLYTGWTLLGAGAVWLGISRIRHWDWV
jgi:hypothetical protein